MKKVLVSLFGLLFVAVVGVLAWKMLVPAGTPAQAELVATNVLDIPMQLEVTAGQATVLRKDADSIAVTEKLDLKEGDTVRVETSAKANLLWTDGSVTRLAGGTEVVVTKATTDAATGATQNELEVRTGQAWTKVLNVVHDDSSMQVRTQNTVAGIRGTTLYTSVSSTGVVMFPLEHGIDLMVTGAEKREILLAGEAYVVRGTQGEKAATGTLMNSFIEENTTQDASYLARVNSDRRTRFMEKMQKAGALPDREQFVKSVSEKEGTSAEREKELGAVLDILVKEMIAAQESKDTVRLAELTEYYEELVPALANAAGDDNTLREMLRSRVTMHAAVLFSGGVEDDAFLTRQALARARLALLPKSDNDALKRALRREMFFALDQAAAGKERQVEEVLTLVRGDEKYQNPLLETATPAERELFDRVAGRIEEKMPGVTNGVQSLRRQLYKQEAATNLNENLNINDNTNAEPVNTNLNTNTAAERTNANTNTAVRRTNTNTNTARVNTNTNTVRQTNTNTAPKPTTTTTSPTTTVTPKPTTTTTPTTTLVPAPVRTTTPTTTTRPVLTSTP